MSEEQLSKILANVYGDGPGYIQWMIEKYGEYYDLPIIEKTEEITPRLFQFYERGKYFVVLAITNQANEVLIVKDSQSDSIWRLIGGFVQNGEGIEEACDRLIKDNAALQIDGIEPVAIVKNHFLCQGRTLLHCGLAFLVQAQGIPIFPLNYKGVYVAQCPEQLVYSNQEILRIAVQKLGDQKIFAPYDEIDTNRKYVIRRFIHKAIINRLFGHYSSRHIKQRISKYCEGAGTIIDVACGDDVLILDLARGAKFCVANDISWSLLRQLRKKAANRNIIFTNHNILGLPFSRRFDILICKNVLHHVHNINEFIALTGSIKDFGSRLILVDIENPRKSSFRAKLWNDYYRCFLGDLGNYFLTQEEFQNALSCVYEGKKFAFDTVSTIKGNYMFAIVDL